MKIDLSVIVDEKILKVMASMASQGEIASVAKFGHIGTHFDVMDKQFSLENTERRGIIFDVRDVKDREIEINDINMDDIMVDDFVIFCSGFLEKKKFGTPEYFRSKIELSNELITDLVNKRVSMIGIDFPAVRNPSEHLKADQYCADNEIFIVENLANLEKLVREVKGNTFVVHTYPINYIGMTGLPCRIIAEILINEK